MRDSEDSSSDRTASRAVFISYASEDGLAATRLVDALRTVGIDVWFDRSELRGGETWDQRIRQQIRDCALFLPLISRNTEARAEGYFRLEWRLADARTHLMSRNRAFLVPVCIDDTREKDADVPESFATVHWLRAGEGQSTAVLVERVQQLLDDKQGPAPVGSPARISGTRRTRRSARKYAIGAVVALLAIAAGITFYVVKFSEDPVGRRSTTVAADAAQASLTRSVAVLPFVDMSENRDEDYFADGLTEELIERLTHSNDIRVIARTSSFYFKGKPTTISSVAKLLQVTHVVEGSVRKSGNTLRITAQLIRASDGTHVWSGTYDRPLSDIFDVQTEIASQVARAMSAALNGTATPGSTTENVEAYSLMLQGQFYVTRRDAGDIPRAIEVFRRAVQLDPQYVEAWTRLGGAYLLNNDAKEAMAAAAQALQLDPGFPAAHFLTGKIETQVRWNWQAAAAAYERALASSDSPDEKLRIQATVEYLHALQTGRYSSGFWDTFGQLLVRNPLDSLLMRQLAFDYLYDGQFEKGAALLERALQVSPSSVSGNSARAYALLLMSRFDESFVAAQRETSEQSKRGILAMTTWSLGRRAEADGYLHALESDKDTSPYMLAQIHTLRGETNLAFDELKRSFRQHEPDLISFRLDPLLKRLRDDSRYADLLKKMKLAE